MRFLLLSALFVHAPLVAQEPPRAQPVDPALNQDPAEDYFQHGRNVYESAKRSSGQTQFELYGRSIEIFTRYLDEFPRHQNAEAGWWYLGQSYYNIGQVEDAKRCFHSILNRFGRGRYAAAAAYTLAADHFNKREYALAATLFEKLATIASRPSDRTRGLYYAGKSCELMNNSRRAIAHYRAVLADPDPANAYALKARLDLGKLLSAEGKLAEGLELLDSVVNTPTDAEVRGEAALHAGAAAAKLGDADRADRYFNLILTTPGMETHRPDAQIALMAARLDQKRYDDVVRIFRSSTTSAEGETEARRLMIAARAYMMLNRNADALPLFREVERLETPGSDRAFQAAYFRLLCFYRVEGRHVLDQVDAFLSLYSKKHPKDPKVHTAMLMRAETLYADGKLTEAADAYRDIDPAMLTEKNRRGLLYQRGRCFESAGDHDKAAESLGEFIKQFPDDDRVPLARAARGRSLAATGSNAAAIAEFDLVIESTKDPALLTLAYLEGADLLRADNQLDALVTRCQAFLKARPTTDPAAIAKASYWAGWAMVKTNKGNDALGLLENARELAPDAYSKHAGLLLCLVHLSTKNPTALIPEVALAIEKGYAGDLPEPLIRWAADQAFNGKDFTNAARFYDLIADDENPELSPKEVWRFLGKSRLQTGDAAGALPAIEHALKVETDPAWKADGLADKANALLALEKFDEANTAVEEGLAMRPEGRIGALLHMARGDILLAQNKPADAVRSYILPVRLMDDNDRSVRPLALHKLILGLEAAGQKPDAEKYRQELQQKYPDWKP